MALRRITTLELNVTSKTAKTFFADLQKMAKDTRSDIADLQTELSKTKSELAAGQRTGESDVDWANRASALQQTIKDTTENIDKLKGQVRTWETLLKGQLTNVNQLAKAMDDMSGRSLKELNGALKEYQQKLLNIGKAQNFERDQKFLIEYGHLVTGIRQRVNELKTGFLNFTETAREGLKNMGRPLHDIPNILDSINNGLNKMEASDVLDKLKTDMEELQQGRYSGSGKTLTSLFDRLVKYQESFAEGTKDYNLIEQGLLRLVTQYDEIKDKQKELINLRKQRNAANKKGDAAEVARLNTEITNLQQTIKTMNSAMAVRMTADIKKVGTEVLQTIDHAKEGYQRLREDLDAMMNGTNIVNRQQKDGSVKQERMTEADLIGDMSKVLPFIEKGSQEYKDFYEAMKQVYMQDWNVDKMIAVRDALKENIKLFDEESDEFKEYNKLIQQFDARIIEAQNHWKDMQNASQEGLKTMQQQYEQLLKDGQLEGESLDLIKTKLQEIKDLRKQKAEDVLNNGTTLRTSSPETIQASMDAMKELRDAESTSDSDRKRYNETIVKGEIELERQRHLMEMVRMEYQMTKTSLTDLSDDGLDKLVKAYQREADAIVQTEGASANYRNTLAELNKLKDEQYRRTRENADTLLGNQGNNGTASTVAQYKDGIKAANELLESGKLTTAEFDNWKKSISIATYEMQKLSEQESRDVELVRIWDKDIDNVSRESLPGIIQQWTKTIDAEREAGKNVSVYETKLQEAKDKLEELNNDWAENVLADTKNYSTEEINKAISITTEQARKLQTAGDDAWKGLMDGAVKAKKELDSFAQEGKMKLMSQNLTEMTQNIQFMSPVSAEALKHQIQFWKGIRDNANSTADQIQEATNRIIEAEDGIKENAKLRAQSIISDMQTQPGFLNTPAQPGPYWNNGGPGVGKMKEDLQTLKDYREQIDKAFDPGRFKSASDAIAELGDAINRAEKNLLSAEEVDRHIGSDVESTLANINATTAMSAEKLKQLYDSARQSKETLEQKALNLSGKDLEDANQQIKQYNDLMALCKQRINDAAMSEERFNSIIDNLDTASISDLKDVLKELESRIANVQRGTDEYNNLADSIRRVKGLLQETTKAQSEQTSGLEKAIDRIKTYVMVYMSFQKILDLMKGLFRSSQQLSDLTSDIQKRAFTDLSFDKARQSAIEVGTEIDKLTLRTRTSQEQLYKLGATAGLLGLKEKDDITGFVEAADMMSVALVELGEDGAAQLMKISTLTGEVARHGVKDALINVSSSINALTAASAASAGPIVNFITRVGAVGSTAKMSIADIAGLGATIDAIGQPIEMASTASNKLIMALRSNTLGIAASLGMDPDNLQMLVSGGKVMDAMILVLEKMKKKGKDVTSVFGELGGEGTRMKQTIESLMNNTELLREQVRLSNEEYMKGTSVINEYNVKNQNSAAIMERVRNMWSSIFNNAQAEESWRGLSVLILGITKLLTSWPVILKGIIGFIVSASTAMYAFGQSTNKANAGITRMHAGLKSIWKLFKNGRFWFGGFAGTAIFVFMDKVFEGISKWYDKLVDVKKETKEINDILVSQQDKVSSMFDSIKRMMEGGATNTKAFKDALQQLNNEFGSMIGFTVTETTSLEQLAAAQESVNASMRENIRIEGQKSKVAGIQQKYADAKSSAKTSMESELMRDATKSEWTGEYNVSKNGGRTKEYKTVPIEGTKKNSADLALVEIALRESVSKAIKQGFSVDVDSKSTTIDDNKAAVIFADAIKKSGIFNYNKTTDNPNGIFNKEEYESRLPVLRQQFLEYLRAYTAEQQETDAVYRETANDILLDEEVAKKKSYASLTQIYNEYSKKQQEDVSAKTEDEQEAHYARLLELQENYKSKYESSMADLTSAERTEVSNRIKEMEKLAPKYMEKAGTMSQFGFENLDWSKMSGEKLKTESDKLNQVWKYYNKNGDWQAFGNRVGQTFTAEQDAQKWIHEQVQAIADRADFLRISRPSGWQYDPKGRESDPTQDMMNDFLKKLEDYYNQEKAIIRKNAAETGELRETTEAHIYLKEQEYKAARVGLQMMYLKQMNTLSKEEQEQYKLMTRAELDAMSEADKRKHKNIYASIEDYNFGKNFDKNIDFINKSLAENDPKKDKMRSAVQAATSGDLLDFMDAYNERIQSIRKTLLDGNSVAKVVENFRASMVKMQLIFTDRELREKQDSEGELNRRIRILQGFTARINTMTEDEFVELISMTEGFKNRTIEEYQLMYQQLLQHHDDYNEANRKQAQSSLKLMQNRIDSGAYYETQLNALKNYQERMVIAGKSGSDAFMQIAKAIEILEGKQNKLVNGKMTTYAQRQKKALEDANAMVKREEAIGKSGVNNKEQLGRAKVFAARTDLSIAIEEYQQRQEMANSQIVAVMNEIEAADRELRDAQGDAVKTQEAMQKLSELQIRLQGAETQQTTIVGDTYDKMLEKQKAVIEQEAELQSERLGNIKDYMESYNETISKFALAGIEARDAKAFELAELRAKKELGLVSDTERQRFLIIKQNGEYTEKWLTEEERIQEEARIDAQNKRNEAMAEAMQNFTKRMSDMLRESLTRGQELNKQRKQEEDRQKMLQNIHQSSLTVQMNAEQNFTSLLKSELDARLEYYHKYFHDLNEEASRNVQVRKETVAGVGSPSSNSTMLSDSVNTKGARGFATGGIVSGPESGDKVNIRVNGKEMVITQAQQKRLLDIAEGRGIKIEGNDFSALADALGDVVEALSNVTTAINGGTQYQREFIERMMPLLEAELKKQGVDGPFIYSLLAQTSVESDWGRSDASKYHNYGGMTKHTTKLPDEHNIVYPNGKKSQYVEFADDQQFAEEYVAYLNRKGAFNGTWRDFGTRVKKFGYATDPKYADTINSQSRRIKTMLTDKTGGTATPKATEIAKPQVEEKPKFEVDVDKLIQELVDFYGKSSKEDNAGTSNKGDSNTDDINNIALTDEQLNKAHDILEKTGVERSKAEMELGKELGVSIEKVDDILSELKDPTYMQELAVVGNDPKKNLKEVATPRMQGGAVSALTMNTDAAIVSSQAWGDAFASAFSQINLDDTIFTAISTAYNDKEASFADILFNKEAWTSIGQTLGLQLANATGAVLIGKLGDWVNGIYTKRANREKAADAIQGDITMGKMTFDQVTGGKAHKAQDKQVDKMVDNAKFALSATKTASKRLEGGEYDAQAKDAVVQAEVGVYLAEQYKKHFEEERNLYEKELTKYHNIMINQDKNSNKEQVEEARKAYDKMLEDYDKIVVQNAMDKAAMDTSYKYGDTKLSNGNSAFDIDAYAAEKNRQQRFATIDQMSQDGSWMSKLGVSKEDLEKTQMSAADQQMLGVEEQIRDNTAAMVDALTGKNAEGTETPVADSGTLDATTTGVTVEGATGVTGATGEGATQSMDVMLGNSTPFVAPELYSQEAIDEMVLAYEVAYSQMGDAADAFFKKEMFGSEEAAKAAMVNAKKEVKDKQATDKKITAAEQAKQTGIAAMQQVGATASTALGDMVAQASGSQMLGQLTAGLAQAGANAIIGIAQAASNSASQGWWMPAIVTPILTALLGGLVASATSKVKSAKSQISTATGASSGKLTTGMLTYAKGKYNEDEKKGRIVPGMMTFSDGQSYSEGQSYSVDGADGKTYNAKYAGSVSDLGTGIQKGTHFGIFSEVKPEMVIDGDTTKLMHEKYPVLENAIMTLHRTGSLNMPEMLGLNYDNIGRTIQTLTKSHALSFSGGGAGFKMPTFAEGNYPYGESQLKINNEQLTMLGDGGSQGGGNAQMDQLNATLALLQETLAAGITSTVSSKQASKALAKQRRWEARNGVHTGLNG